MSKLIHIILAPIALAVIFLQIQLVVELGKWQWLVSTTNNHLYHFFMFAGIIYALYIFIVKCLPHVGEGIGDAFDILS